MSDKELVADVRKFVRKTFGEVGGRQPSQAAMNRAAAKIAKALRPTIVHEPLKRKTSR